MPVPAIFKDDLALPLIGSPMFICSYPDLVLAQCKAGIVGTFPSLNARPVEELDRWLGWFTQELNDHRAANPGKTVAPFGVNLIVHRSNTRLEEDTDLVVKHRVPFIITSVGAPSEIVPRVHAYGGVVFHDVTNVKHAKKAISVGVDGLILVAAGAGGHAGTMSPFALISEIRQFWDGPIALSGVISNGAQIRAAQVMGADFAYMGTRFIATKEANAVEGYKQTILDSTMADITYTPAFSGIPGNYLTKSIIAEGLDPNNIEGGLDKPDMDLTNPDRKKAKAWKEIWSAGQGVGTIHDVPSVQELVDRLVAEYKAALDLPAWPPTEEQIIRDLRQAAG